MKIDVKHIAKLSRISLTGEELKEFTPQMNTILESASVLQGIDTKDVEPMKEHITFSELREDIPEKSLTQEEVLKNAPHTENGCVKIYGRVFGEEQTGD